MIVTLGSLPFRLAAGIPPAHLDMCLRAIGVAGVVGRDVWKNARVAIDVPGARAVIDSPAGPPGGGPAVVKPKSIDDVPIVALTLWRDRYDSFALRKVADEAALDIKKIPNISEVSVIGGERRQVSLALGAISPASASPAENSLVGWGNNIFNQAQVPHTLSNVVAISAGSIFSLALKADGSVVGWGHNVQGETTMPNGIDIAQLSAGGYFTLILTSSGTVVAVGDNYYGQSNVPAGLSDVIAVSAGGDFGLALKSDGTVAAWGHNNLGQTNVPAESGRCDCYRCRIWPQPDAHGQWHHRRSRRRGHAVPSPW